MIIDAIIFGFALGALFMTLFSLPRIAPVVKYQSWLERNMELESEIMRYSYLNDEVSKKNSEAAFYAHQIKKPRMPWPERMWRNTDR